MIGNFFSYISDTVEKISGLDDDMNDNMMKNIEACRRFYKDKAENKTTLNMFSKFGDIAQVDARTYVDCNRNLIGLQSFHAMVPTKRIRDI